jgi:transposase
MHKLSASTITSVLSLLHQGLSTRDIQLRTGVSLGAISAIRSKHASGLPKSQGGRPQSLSSTTTRWAVRQVTNEQNTTAASVARELRSSGDTITSAKTIRSHLKIAGLKPVVKQKRPFLSIKHKRARLDFATKYLHWTLEDWKHVIFSDETKINRLGSDGRK